MNKYNSHITKFLSGNKPQKNNGFCTPENYFETIEEEILADLKIAKLKKQANINSFKLPTAYFENVENKILIKLKLEGFKTEESNEYKTPSNYFESIENSVLDQLKNEIEEPNKTISTSKVISLRTKLVKYIAPIGIAASLALIISLQFKTQKVTFDSLPSSDLENLINTGVIDIDAYKIASLDPTLNIEIDNNLSNDEMSEYLSKQDVGNLLTESQ